MHISYSRIVPMWPWAVFMMLISNCGFVFVCVCVCWGVCVCVGGGGSWDGSFRMVLCVGCLGGTVPALRVYRISYFS